MNYQSLVRDFAKRTQRNLELIRRAEEDGEEAYEVTQLINSMLGLIVLPKERYYENIPETPLAELRRQGWPEPLLAGAIDAPQNLREVLRMLRNSIAHFNVEFTEAGGQIDGVILTNKHHGRITWRAMLGLADLEEITRRFIGLIQDQRPA
ncbi:MAG: HEPN family nuclease [Chthoniobacteraceae bacterium]